MYFLVTLLTYMELQKAESVCETIYSCNQCIWI